MRPAPDFRLPRLVLVTRKTMLEQLLERHGTLSQARFYLESRGQRSEDLEEAHERFRDALRRVETAIPADQRRTRVDRGLLDRFLFADDDCIFVVGQDGLVPNVAKYLEGQAVIGINSDPERFDGVLCPHAPEDASALVAWSQGEKGSFVIQQRAMAQATREDGRKLLALNELYVGHTSHQSARYRIQHKDRSERHSSSGLICTTGTGATGWARSICSQRKLGKLLPGPEDRRLAFFVREPFPSNYTGTSIDHGILHDGQELTLESELAEGGVVFADGIESDRLEFVAGQKLKISVAERSLRLVVTRTT